MGSASALTVKINVIISTYRKFLNTYIMVCVTLLCVETALYKHVSLLVCTDTAYHRPGRHHTGAFVHGTG